MNQKEMMDVPDVQRKQQHYVNGSWKTQAQQNDVGANNAKAKYLSNSQSCNNLINRLKVNGSGVKGPRANLTSMWSDTKEDNSMESSGKASEIMLNINSNSNINHNNLNSTHHHNPSNNLNSTHNNSSYNNK